MKPTVKYLVWGNLAIITVLAFLYPHLLISPGQLIVGHKELETDCFACHSPLFGATDKNCIACHKVDDIGLKNSKGVPLPKPNPLMSFHQKLDGKECIGCHTDHAGMTIYRTMSRFAHDTLTKAELRKCESCHLKIIPKDELHDRSTQRCKNCHTPDKWKPTKKDKSHYMSLPFMSGPAPVRRRTLPAPIVTPPPVQQIQPRPVQPERRVTPPSRATSSNSNFRHEDVPRAERRLCLACHKTEAPKDNIHNRPTSERCGRCHTTDKWVPLKPNAQF